MLCMSPWSDVRRENGCRHQAPMRLCSADRSYADLKYLCTYLSSTVFADSVSQGASKEIPHSPAHKKDLSVRAPTQRIDCFLVLKSLKFLIFTLSNYLYSICNPLKCLHLQFLYTQADRRSKSHGEGTLTVLDGVRLGCSCLAIASTLMGRFISRL
jgi:hypothetical protein